MAGQLARRRMVVCEDAEQAAKIAQVRDQLPDARAGRRDRDGPRRACASAAARATRRRCSTAPQAVTPEDPYTFIYTSGTTGPPKGCVLSHGNYRAIMDSVEEQGILGQMDEDEVVYLYLPLAHAYALLIQLLCADLGVPLAYFSGDATQIIPEFAEVKPTYLPSVPRIFEKLYTMVAGQADPDTIAKATAGRDAGARARARRPGGPRRAAGRLRPVRRRAVRQGPRDLRRPRHPGDLRRRADRQGDPRVLLRRRRPRASRATG